MNDVNVSEIRKQKVIRILGWFLVGIITFSILIYFILLTTATMHSATVSEYDLWTVPRITRRTGQIYLLFLLLFLALCLSSQKKIVVLYLRKFRLNTDILSPKYKGGLRSNVRIVTLQDETFPSKASVLKDRIIIYLTTFVISITAILLVYFLGVGGINTVSEGNFFLFSYTYMIIIYAIWIGFTLIIFILFYLIKLNKNKVIRITKPLDIASASNKVATLNSIFKRPSLLGCKSTLVETSNRLWNDTVSSLIKRCSIAIIDVSHLTDNIIWEIKECLNTNIPIILIYSEEFDSESSHVLNQISSQLDFRNLSNIPTLKFPVSKGKELNDFRNKLGKILKENYRHSGMEGVVDSYYTKHLFIYLVLFLVSIILASFIIVFVIYLLFPG